MILRRCSVTNAFWFDQKRHSANSMQSTITRWEWNEIKAARNFEKHKVSFALAAAALEDSHQQSQLDVNSNEHRFRTLAKIENVVLIIVHTEPELERFSGDWVGRIISARLAKPAERRAYNNA